MMQTHSGIPPVLRQNHALFLDIDGTLLDIAEAPDAVIVPSLLVPLLGRISDLLGGAVALVSGRPLAQIDALMAPLVMTCAGEHGAVLRLPDGAMECAGEGDGIPETWRTRLSGIARDLPGVLFEPKSFGAAMHYRKAPSSEENVRHAVSEIVAENPRDFEMLPASMAYEIRNRKLTKAGPVFRLMQIAPFAGRIPVFVGDDVTDHDGFRAVNSLKGMAIDVHESFAGRPANVLDWLSTSVTAGLE